MKYVYLFSEGSKEMKALLGGKGANLSEMTREGLPIPEGFVITTEACMNYLNKKMDLKNDLMNDVLEQISQLEQLTGKKLNGQRNPLLLSVRSGAQYSMPGMMDTILNLGLNDVTVEALATETQDERFAYDCYRRFIQMYGNVVMGIDINRFEQYFEHMKETCEITEDHQLTATDLKQIVKVYQEIYQEVTQTIFPQDPLEQLTLAIEAVFNSWHNHRAYIYRNRHGIPHDLGTGVTVQLMVFGNKGETSGTGVLFTRHPSEGTDEIFGEYLVNAQGEDVVAGIRTPQPIEQMAAQWPDVYQELAQHVKHLERHYRDMQDVEFTVEEGKLYILQTRNGKRTARAAFQIAHDLVEENLLTPREALARLTPNMADELLHPVFVENSETQSKWLAKGLPASPGAATGRIVFNTVAAKEWTERGESVILVRQETSPEDVEGMLLSQGILTSRGGMTSHAAVVARGLGTCCIVGCQEVIVNETTKTMTTASAVFREGDEISIDGNTGNVYQGAVETESAEEMPVFETILGWADEIATMKVKANAETPKEMALALKFGAQGFGLVRTEHMFFSEDNLKWMRHMILAENVAERTEALKVLGKNQVHDFKQLLDSAQGAPFVIRLLDPPLHEFLPHTEQEIQQVAQQLGKRSDNLAQKLNDLKEVNPMLGHRGCRLAITYPKIYEMQLEAILTSLSETTQALRPAVLEVMIPLVGSHAELALIRQRLEVYQANWEAQHQERHTIRYGTMIEIPRACVTADKLAESSDFFSFGTNDLTQMTYGFSRDDVYKFIGEYVEQGLLPHDPFQHVDTEGVGELMRMAVEKGRQTNPDLPIGICGEVGGDPQSIEFYQTLGLNYVSCSPYRVPSARLAVAQAAM